tara:strand:+ start:37 stop:162 length:126 start_codon:yes stop_codon:yes gene_type:complete
MPKPPIDKLFAKELSEISPTGIKELKGVVTCEYDTLYSKKK